MKNVNLLFLSVILLLVSCKEETPSLDVQHDPNITSIEGIWKLILIEDASGESISKTEENSWGLDVLITIEDEGDPFKIYGKNTSNEIFGDFDYLDDRNIQVHAMGSTYVNQPEWGNKFATVFYGAELSFSINNQYLQFYNAEKDMSITLERM